VEFFIAGRGFPRLRGFYFAKPRQNILFSVGDFPLTTMICGGAVILGGLSLWK